MCSFRVNQNRCRTCGILKSNYLNKIFFLNWIVENTGLNACFSLTKSEFNFDGADISNMLQKNIVTVATVTIAVEYDKDFTRFQNEKLVDKLGFICLLIFDPTIWESSSPISWLPANVLYMAFEDIFFFQSFPYCRKGHVEQRRLYFLTILKSEYYLIIFISVQIPSFLWS